MIHLVTALPPSVSRAVDGVGAHQSNFDESDGRLGVDDRNAGRWFGRLSYGGDLTHIEAGGRSHFGEPAAFDKSFHPLRKILGIEQPGRPVGQTTFSSLPSNLHTSPDWGEVGARRASGGRRSGVRLAFSGADVGDVWEG